METFVVKSSHQSPLRFKGKKLLATDYDDRCGGEVYLSLEAYETEKELIFVKRSDYRFCPEADEFAAHFVKYLVINRDNPRPPELYKFCSRKEGATRAISHDFIDFLENVGFQYDLDSYFFYLSPAEAVAYDNDNT